MSEVDGGTCWKCGTKREQITQLQAENSKQQQWIRKYGWVDCGCGDRYPFYSTQGQALLTGEMCENCQGIEEVKL